MIPRLDNSAQDLLRDLAPQVLGVLLRRYRDFGGCEDAVQEALHRRRDAVADAGDARQPERLADHRGDAPPHRSDPRRHRAPRLREQLVVSLIPADEQIALAADAAGVNERDETLDLYFMCCHPASVAGVARSP